MTHVVNQDPKPALSQLQQFVPEVMDCFKPLAGLAINPPGLEAKVSALITLSLAIQNQSLACIEYHVNYAKQQGLTSEEMQALIAIAAYMGGGPALMAAEQALEFFNKE